MQTWKRQTIYDHTTSAKFLYSPEAAIFTKVKNLVFEWGLGLFESNWSNLLKTGFPRMWHCRTNHHF